MENKVAIVVVRETIEIKNKLVDLAKKNGFNELSQFIREQWRKWL